MPKRKRDDNSLEARLGRVQTELLRALKTAKAFERQRQSKRARDPASTADKRARIDREVAVLKSLDLSRAAAAHLAASIVKHKPLAAASDRLPEAIRQPPPKPEGLSELERAALHNVTSSLYNKPAVRTIVETAVLDVCRELGVEEPRGRGKRVKEEPDARKGGKEEPDARERGKEEPDAKEQKVHPVEAEPAQESNTEDAEEDTDGEETDEWDGVEASDDDPEGRNAPPDLDSDAERAEEALLAQYDHLLGGSSESESEDDNSDDDDDNDDNDDDDNDDGRTTLFRQRSKHRFTDDGISLSSRSPSPEPAPPSKRLRSAAENAKISKSAKSTESTKPSVSAKPSTKASKHTSHPGTSTFLPSLMGGYISGSESEASDVDVAPAKKRLGQRQRQLIWEKKYGAGANHVKKQQQQQQQKKKQQKQQKDRDAGWDMRRGAVGEGDEETPWKRGVANPLADASKDASKGRAKDHPKKDPPKKDAPVHPSWAAKARQKQVETQVRARAQGSKPVKVVFDD